MPINLRRVGEVADGSVTTAKLADNAVTTQKLNDGAVTGVKADGSIKTSYLVADDTTVSYTGTAYSNQLVFSLILNQHQGYSFLLLELVLNYLKELLTLGIYLMGNIQ